MKIYDAKGSLLVDYGLHASEHESGGSDEVSLGTLSGEITLAQMTRGDSGKGLVGKGSGADPAYEYVTHAKEGGRNIWVQVAQPTAVAPGDIWIEI